MPRSAKTSDLTSESHANALDVQDLLAPFRQRFYVQPGTIYLDGNSLGLLSRDAEVALLRLVISSSKLRT